jgi:hypothetical protein
MSQSLASPAARAPRAASSPGGAEKRDELAAFHSIISSARASTVAGDVEAERLGGLEIDDEFELGRLIDRQVGRLGALAASA